MTHPPSVVLAAAEAVPLAKTGGLGDVVGALSGALAAAGAAVTVVLPAYAHIDRARYDLRRQDARLAIPLGSRLEPGDLWLGRLPDSAARVVLIEHPGFFARDGMYVDPATGMEYPDAAARWVFFSKAVVAALPRLGPAPDILHLNDHHCALGAAFHAAGHGVPAGFLRHTAVVFSIHNLGYQGLYAPADFALTGLPAGWMAPLGPLEFWGRMNCMKAGLVLADALTTVSPTYAVEIQASPEFGFGLEGVLRTRAAHLFGILNGIDTQAWDPGRDPLLPARYDLSLMDGKPLCKQALQQRFGLAVEPHVPLIGLVSRLVEQKGIDLLIEALPALVALPLQIVLLGSGHPELETRLRAAAAASPARLAVQFGYDDTLAHWIEAGSDFFLMPSRYEPCGLNQMYSMRYGTVPIVRRTGGLADTVRDWDGEQGTGLVFEPYTPAALLACVRRALHVYGDGPRMQALRRAGMQQDFSWARAAQRYLEVYEQAIERRRDSARSMPGGASAARGGH